MLGRKSLTLFISQWFGVIANLVTSILIARLLGPERVGQMAFCFGLIGLFMMITTLGFQQAHVKRVADGLQLEQCLAAYGIISLTLNGLAFLAAAIAWPTLSRTLTAPAEQMAFILFFAYQVLLNLSQVLTQTFVGRQEMAKISLSSIISKCVRLAAVAGMLYWKRSLPAVGIALLLEALAQIVMAIYFLPQLKKPIRITRSILISYWEYAKPLMILSPVSTLMDTVDRVILGAAFSSAQLGYYSIARNMYESYKSLQSAILTVLAPRLAAEYSLADRSTLRRTFRQAYRKMLLIITPVSVLSMAFVSLAIRCVYGSTYLPAAGAAAAFFFVGWVVAVFTPFPSISCWRPNVTRYCSRSTPSRSPFICVVALWAVGHWNGSLSAAALTQLALWLIPAVPVFWSVRDLTGTGFTRQTARIALAGTAMIVCFALIPGKLSGILLGSVSGCSCLRRLPNSSDRFKRGNPRRFSSILPKHPPGKGLELHAL